VINSGAWQISGRPDANEAFLRCASCNDRSVKLYGAPTFLRGCDILSKIHDHDYVIQYLEHGKIAEPLLLMEYVERSNLEAAILARGIDVAGKCRQYPHRYGSGAPTCA